MLSAQPLLQTKLCCQIQLSKIPTWKRLTSPGTKSHIMKDRKNTEMRWKEVSLKKYFLKVKLHFSLFPELPNPNKLLGKLLCGCSQARSKFTIKAKFYLSSMSKGFLYPKNITSRKKLLFGNVLDSLKGDRSCITKNFVHNKPSEVLLNIWF